MSIARRIALAVVLAAALGPAAAGAGAPTASVSGPAGAVAIDGGLVGGERWKLVAYRDGGERCLDVLFRGDPCRGCGSKVPGGADVEFRRHTYLYDRRLTFIVVEASRRVERVKLNLTGRRSVSLRVRDPFEVSGFRFGIAVFNGNALVRSVAAYDRDGRFVQRSLG